MFIKGALPFIRMTEAEIAESKEEIDSYLNQMLVNFEGGDLAPSVNTYGPKNANTLPELISTGKSNKCKFGAVGANDWKRKRTPGSSSRWSGGTWTDSWTGTTGPREEEVDWTVQGDWSHGMLGRARVVVVLLTPRQHTYLTKV